MTDTLNNALLLNESINAQRTAIKKMSWTLVNVLVKESGNFKCEKNEVHAQWGSKIRPIDKIEYVPDYCGVVFTDIAGNTCGAEDLELVVLNDRDGVLCDYEIWPYELADMLVELVKKRENL